MTKKLYLPFLNGNDCCINDIVQQKMGELSSDYFTVTPQVLEAVV